MPNPHALVHANLVRTNQCGLEEQPGKPGRHYTSMKQHVARHARHVEEGAKEERRGETDEDDQQQCHCHGMEEAAAPSSGGRSRYRGCHFPSLSDTLG
jgi:hypothetical protein